MQKKNIKRSDQISSILLLLIIVLLALFFDAYKNAHGSVPISVRIEGLSYFDLDSISVARITGRGRLEALSRDGFEWVLAKRGFAKELRLEILDENIINKAFNVHVSIGNKDFAYSSIQVLTYWERCAGKEMAFSTPNDVRGSRSNCPLFSRYINWAGDGAFAVKFLRIAFLPLSAVGILIAFFFEVKRRIKSDAGAPGNIWLSLLAVASFCAIAIGPVLGTGYISDDSANVSRLAVASARGLGLDSIIRGDTENWLHAGRLFPINIALSDTIFAVFGDSVKMYKLYLVAASILGIFAFAFAVRQTGADPGVAVGVAASLPLLWQLRDYHDPMLSFNGFTQILFILLALSIFALQAFVTEGKKRYLLAHCLCYLVSLLLYELAYTFIFFYLFAAIANIRAPVKRRTLALSFSLALTASVAFVFMLLQNAFGNGYSGTAFSLHPAAILSAFVMQISASLPLVYGFFSGDFAEALGRTNALAWVVSAAYGCFMASILGRDAGSDKKASLPRWLMAVGIGLVTLPAALLALSSKYQHDLDIGKGYLPVYFQYFGVAILAFPLVVSFSRRYRFLSALVLSFMYLSNLSMNGLMADKANDAEPSAKLFAAAMSAGLLSDVPDGAEVLFFGGGTPPVEFGNSPFIERFSGKRLAFVQAKGIMAQTGKRLYILRIEESSDGHGYALLADANFKSEAGRFEADECSVFLPGNGRSAPGTLRYMSLDMARVAYPHSEAIGGLACGTVQRVRFARPVLFETIGASFE